MSSKGRWYVGRDVGKDKGSLKQISDFTLGPDQVKPWQYYNTISLVGDKKSKKYEAASIIVYYARRNGDMSTRQP